MTDPQPPVPAIAVSPTDQSSDRQQSDDNNTSAVSTAGVASNERADMKEAAALNQAITMGRLDKLIDSSDRQTRSNEALAKATDHSAAAMVEYQERARLAAYRFRVSLRWYIATVLIVLLAAAATIIVLLNQGDRGRAQIADCVKPTGQCYKDGVKRSAAVVAELQKITEFAAICAPSYVGLSLNHRRAAIEACIKKELAR